MLLLPQITWLTGKNVSVKAKMIELIQDRASFIIKNMKNLLEMENKSLIIINTKIYISSSIKR